MGKFDLENAREMRKGWERGQVGPVIGVPAARVATPLAEPVDQGVVHKGFEDGDEAVAVAPQQRQHALAGGAEVALDARGLCEVSIIGDAGREGGTVLAGIAIGQMLGDHRRQWQ